MQCDATVLICTYDRATFLGATLDSLARSRVSRIQWNVLVVDNNSSDGTREVVMSRVADFPVRLTYLFEPRQGKSLALNTGLAATQASFVAFTDDDVMVPPGWLEAACGAMIDDPSIDYTGGPVRPIWETAAPPWFDRERSDLWGTLAILDYGPTPFVFEDRQRVPLGANMAVRRTLIDRVGGFDPEFGRKGGSLLGQEQAEFFCRPRAAGARGWYEPAMELYHHVPARRMTKEYFRRWWYWKGVSKALLERRHPITELGIDLRSVRQLARVPQFMVGSALRDTRRWAGACFEGNAIERMRREVRLCYFFGYIRGAHAGKKENTVHKALNRRKGVPTSGATSSLHL